MILIVAIRRAIMDSFWIREPGTVKGGFNKVNVLRKVSGEELGLDECISPLGPYNIEDKV